MRGEPYLIPPGKRRGNKFYLIRGNFDGKIDAESSTGTTDERLANQMLAEVKYNEVCGLRARELKTFNFAADQYIAWKNPSKRERGFIDKMRPHIGDDPVNELTQSDLVALANKLYPKGKGSAKNRAVMRPASAILHYAAKPSHKWCDYWSVELFEEAPVKKRAMSIEEARKLIVATEGKRRLLLIWLFKHSDRITASLMVKGSEIHMDEDYYDRLTGKKKKVWQKAPLDPEVKRGLIEVYGSNLPQGRIFCWSSRQNTYRWLKPLCKRIGVKFTPHMARHSILTWISDAGGNAGQIKTRGGHASLKSSEPYLAENLKVTRDITAQFVLDERKSIRVISRVRKPRKAKK